MHRGCDPPPPPDGDTYDLSHYVRAWLGDYMVTREWTYPVVSCPLPSDVTATSESLPPPG